MKILYACNDLEFFIAHRLFLAKNMQARNNTVYIAVEESADESKIPDFNLIRLSLNRYRFSPLQDIKLLFGYYRTIKTYQPDIIHAITIKPILFLSIVMLFLRASQRPKLVLTFPGLGKIFEDDAGLYHSLRRMLVTNTLRFCQRRNQAYATFENTGNQKTTIDHGIVSVNTSNVLMGAGIGEEFVPVPRKNSKLVVSFAGRLLRAKGAGLFVDAARKLAEAGVDAEFLVAGEWDPNNPDSIEMEIIEEAEKDGVIKYVGNIPGAEVHKFLQQTDIFCLPSMLNEGLPRAMLEAAACGCALLVSDQVSTRPFVKDGATGRRLSPVTAEQIYSDLERMVGDREKTRQMGKNAAELVSDLPIREDQIFNEFLSIYETANAST